MCVRVCVYVCVCGEKENEKHRFRDLRLIVQVEVENLQGSPAVCTFREEIQFRSIGRLMIEFSLLWGSLPLA